MEYRLQFKYYEDASWAVLGAPTGAHAVAISTKDARQILGDVPSDGRLSRRLAVLFAGAPSSGWFFKLSSRSPKDVGRMQPVRCPEDVLSLCRRSHRVREDLEAYVATEEGTLYLVFKPWMGDDIAQETRLFVVRDEIVGHCDASTDEVLPWSDVESALDRQLQVLHRAGYTTYCLDLHKRKSDGGRAWHITELNPLDLSTDCFYYTYHELLLERLSRDYKRLQAKYDALVCRRC